MNKNLFLLSLLLVNITVNTAIAEDMSPTAIGGSDLINFSAVVPHDHDYYTKQVRNVELIYTEKNLDTASQVADIQILLQPPTKGAKPDPG